MAKKKQRRRSRPRGVNALALAESYAQLHIWSMAATNLSPWNFLTSDETGGVAGASGANTVTLKELITGFNRPHGSTGKTESQWVWDNISKSWVNAAISSVGVGIGFRVVSKLLAKPRRMANKLLKDMNLSSVVRV